MNRYIFSRLCFAFCMLSFVAKSQKKDTLKNVQIAEVLVVKSKNKKENKRFNAIKEAYPYHLAFVKAIDKIDAFTTSEKNKRKIKQFKKLTFDSLMIEFKGLSQKPLSVTVGNCMMLLISRRRHQSLYEIAVNLNGKFSANLWHAASLPFGINIRHLYNSASSDSTFEKLTIDYENSLK